MPNRKGSKVFPGYARKNPPDKDLLARLTIKAIGADRTQKEFAELCNVDPSTISRLIRCQYSSGCSETLIQKIAEYADTDSGVTLEKLLDAFGMERINPEETEKGNVSLETRFPESARSGKAAARSEKEAINLIIAQLVLAGYNVKAESCDDSLIQNNGVDLRLVTDALADIGIEKWDFYIKLGIYETVRDPMEQIMNRLYLRGKSEKKKASSLVTRNKKLFRMIQKKYENVVLSDYVSVILLDTIENIVLDKFKFQLEEDIHKENSLAKQAKFHISRSELLKASKKH